MGRARRPPEKKPGTHLPASAAAGRRLSSEDTKTPFHFRFFSEFSPHAHAAASRGFGANQGAQKFVRRRLLLLRAL